MKCPACSDFDMCKACRKTLLGRAQHRLSFAEGNCYSDEVAARLMRDMAKELERLSAKIAELEAARS